MLSFYEHSVQFIVVDCSKINGNKLRLLCFVFILFHIGLVAELKNVALVAMPE